MEIVVIIGDHIWYFIHEQRYSRKNGIFLILKLVKSHLIEYTSICVIFLSNILVVLDISNFKRF